MNPLKLIRHEKDDSTFFCIISRIIDSRDSISTCHPCFMAVEKPVYQVTVSGPRGGANTPQGPRQGQLVASCAMFIWF